MPNLFAYEAPYGQALDGFVGRAGEPGRERHISIIARPSARSMHPIAVDIMRCLGADRDAFTKAQSAVKLLRQATAWSLSRGMSDLYVGEAQDFEQHLDECIEFAHGAGLDLHLVYGFGQTREHGPLLAERATVFHEFSDMPASLRGHDDSRGQTNEQEPEPILVPRPPDEPWTAYRYTYTSLLSPAEVDACERVYLAAYDRTRMTEVQTTREVAELIGEIWTDCGLSDSALAIVVKATQAALFRNGFNLRVEYGLLERHLLEYHVIRLAPEHYRMMRGFSDPWRSAATILHAHRVSTEAMMALGARDVTPTGEIPGLDINLPEDGRAVLAAQRFAQLLGDDPSPPFLEGSEIKIRNAIRYVVINLDLPVRTNWRLHGRRNWRQRDGLRLDVIA